MSPELNQPVSSTPEAEEPSARGPVVPIWLMILLFLLLYWGALYFDRHGGWFNADVYSPFGSIQQVQALQPAGSVGMFDLGRAVYNRPTCVACHQPNGEGTPGTFPSLVGTDWVLEPEPGRLIRLVLHGMTGPVTVKGQLYNNTMVPWGGPPPAGLTDEEIAAVLTYVRQEWGNDAPEVTVEQVQAVRQATENRRTPYTADELLQIPPSE